MKKIKSSTFVFFVLATLAPLTGCANPSATFKVRVINEEGQPVSGVRSELINVFDYGEAQIGLTDKDGLYSKHLNKIFEVGGYFEKSGYYKTSGVFWEAPEWGAVPPANADFTFILRRIIDPVPMTYKFIYETYLPLNDEPVGFDLEVGDWVFPHGKGKTADIQMTGTARYESLVNREAKVTVDFIGELCGIQSFMRPRMNASVKVRSALTPPYTAPDDGYEPTFSLWRIFNRKVDYYAKTHEVVDRHYLFRTRVVVNDDGEIIRTNYGWFDGEIIVDTDEKKRVFMRFSYYYNPNPYSRSLEPKEIADRQVKNIPGGEN